MATPYNMVSGDAQRALEEFSSEFDAALAVADPEAQWAAALGLHNSSRAIKTTYPIPVSAAGYRLREGDDKMRSLYARSLSMQPREYQDGWAEKAMIVEAGDFSGFAGEPARIAREGLRHPNILVANLLTANANLGFYKDDTLGTDLSIPMFSTVHPVNIFDEDFNTFSNITTGYTDINTALFKVLMLAFRTRKGPNGKNMGLRFDTLLCPAAKEQEAKDFLESDNLALLVENKTGNENVGGVWTNNRFKSSVNLIIGDELNDDNIIYALDSKAGVFPWILQDGGAPEQITYDKNDAMYKDEGKIGVKFITLAAAAGALPHAIQRIDLSA